MAAFLLRAFVKHDCIKETIYTVFAIVRFLDDRDALPGHLFFSIVEALETCLSVFEHSISSVPTVYFMAHACEQGLLNALAISDRYVCFFSRTGESAMKKLITTLFPRSIFYGSVIHHYSMSEI